MFLEESALRTNVACGVLKMVQDVSRHPAVKEVEMCLQSKCHIARIVEKALILAALCKEPEFVQYILDMKSVSSSAVSQFTVEKLNPSVESVLNGNLHLPEFVLKCLVDYVAL